MVEFPGGGGYGGPIDTSTIIAVVVAVAVKPAKSRRADVPRLKDEPRAGNGAAGGRQVQGAGERA